MDPPHPRSPIDPAASSPGPARKRLRSTTKTPPHDHPHTRHSRGSKRTTMAGSSGVVAPLILEAQGTVGLGIAAEGGGIAQSPDDNNDNDDDDDDDEGDDRRRRANVILSPSPSFDLIVVGCGGGPCEDNLSAYFVKSTCHKWEDGFTGIEAGSGLGVVRQLIEQANGLHNSPFYDFHQPPPPLSPNSVAVSETLDVMAAAGSIYKSLKCFAITHAHCDHISALILSAGALANLPKSVWGSEHTMRNVKRVFDGGLWPNLGSDEDARKPLWYRPPLKPGFEVEICTGISLRMYPIAHGANPKDPEDLTKDPYQSSAFFFTNTDTRRQFLFFGDLGPDSVSGLKLNETVWKETATVIEVGLLSTIFIECSYPSSRRREVLYGHLSPPYLFEELEVLASFLPPSHLSTLERPNLGRLLGLNIVIIHVKDDAWPISHQSALPPTPHPLGPGRIPTSQHMRDWIGQEISQLELQMGLGCQFHIAQQGDRIEL